MSGVLWATGLLINDTSAVTLKTDTISSIVSDVADIIQGRGDSVVEEEALRYVNRVIDMLNLGHRYYFMRDKQTDVDLAADTVEYAITDSVFMVDDVQLLNSDSEIVRTLQYIKWGQFNRMEAVQTATGLPTVWTIRTRYQNKYIQVYPIPTSDEATYDLRIHFKARIAQLTSADDSTVTGPRELSEVLRRGGEFYLARARERHDKEFLDRLERQFLQSQAALEALDKVQDEEHFGFQIQFE